METGNVSQPLANALTLQDRITDVTRIANCRDAFGILGRVTLGTWSGEVFGTLAALAHVVSCQLGCGTTFPTEIPSKRRRMLAYTKSL